MANSEQALTQSAYSKDITLAAGTASTAVSNLWVGVSHIVGITRKTAGGTTGTPSIQSLTGAAAGAAQATTVVLKSTNALDTSVYTIWWLNEIGPGLLAC
jgi:hypothetical protein